MTSSNIKMELSDMRDVGVVSGPHCHTPYILRMLLG